MNRASEPGWQRIGAVCSAGRRSLWVRYHACSDTGATCAFELCAGREGDDAHVLIDDSHPQFAELLDVVNVARFASET